ncbi:hypothetical protein NC651_006335 [Populus alba x Populus x berolinensis]|nr:hypothetical protein NC651_006335 [Populus alba x Populus x berolinensis]
MLKTNPSPRLPPPPPPPRGTSLPPPRPFHALSTKAQRKKRILSLQEYREKLKNYRVVATRAVKGERPPRMRIMGSIRHIEE